MTTHTSAPSPVPPSGPPSVPPVVVPTISPSGMRRRFPPLFGFLPVFTWGLRFTIRGKRFLLVTALAVVMGAVLGMEGAPGRGWAQSYDPAGSLFRTLDEALLKFVLPLIALLLVAQGYAREVTDRTLVYHLVRPVSRRTVFLARYASGVVGASFATIVLVGTLLALSGVTLPPSTWLAILGTSLVGVTAIGAVYYTLASMFKFGTIAGLVYTFVVELFLAGSRGNMQTLSLMYHVRSLHHRLTDDVLLPMVKGSTSLQGLEDMGPKNPLLGAAQQIEYERPAEALLVLAVLAAAVLLVGLWNVSRRDFALKD